ncbi:site-specific integrase [Paraburkholderia strydomiana]|uniref:Site-specific integrase n=1 Tax=Paraburkholderia strydomiana TaxID=1245417 RepID=A0ABW9ES50_9BURK
MTPLRQRMVEDMRVRSLSANTQRAYLQQVGAFAKHFGRSPATLGPEEIRAWQLHLVEVRQLARSSLVTATAALRFLYTVTLKRDWSVDDIVMSKQPRTLPVILSREDVTAFFESIRSLKHRAILMTAYAGGLRISEVTRLKVNDIDSQRMVLGIEQGKGQVDRYVMLSPRLLEILRTHWQTGRPQHWLFPGRFADQPIVPATIRLACRIRPRIPVIERTSLMADDSPIAMTGGYSCRKRGSCMGMRRVWVHRRREGGAIAAHGRGERS